MKNLLVLPFDLKIRDFFFLYLQEHKRPVGFEQHSTVIANMKQLFLKAIDKRRPWSPPLLRFRCFTSLETSLLAYIHYFVILCMYFGDTKQQQIEEEKWWMVAWSQSFRHVRIGAWNCQGKYLREKIWGQQKQGLRGRTDYKGALCLWLFSYSA